MSPWPWRRALAAASVALLWGGAFTLAFSLWLFQGQRVNRVKDATIEKVAFGGARRPFHARILVPGAARLLLSPFAPETRRAWIERRIAAHPGFERWLAYFRVGRDHAPETALALLLGGSALLGFMFALRRWFDELFVGPAWAARLAPPLAVMLLPLAFPVGAHFAWDFPALLFFTLALRFAYVGNVPMLYAVFLLGTLNKETMALALLALLLPEARRRLGERWIRHFVGLALVVALTRAAALALSVPQGGLAPDNNYLRTYIVGNLLVFVRDPFLYYFEKVAALLVLALLIFGRLREKPRFLVGALPIVLAFVALYLWGSQWAELRALYDVYAIVFLLGFQTFLAWAGTNLRARAPEDSAGLPEAAGDWPLAASATCLLIGAGALAAGLLLPVAAIGAFAG